MFVKKNSFILHVVGLLALVFATSCSTERGVDTEHKGNDKTKEAIASNHPTHGMLKGVIRVQLSEDIANSFSIRSASDGSLRSGFSNMDTFLQEIGATNMEPVFVIDPRFEKRMKKYGLHLFYDVTFEPEKTSTQRALRAVKDVPEITIAEEIPEYKMMVTAKLPDINLYSTTNKYLPIREGVGAPFNDPLLHKQWHYHNDGTAVLRSVPGADLNLYEAWKIEVGKPNVIIGVADQAVDYNHEDLKESMWVNTAELNGEPDKDNDGNGFKNDIHGYNFQGKTATLSPGDHGTHVAGTVAARNNNGIGVGGVAGGDGTPESGVRLMTTQIFGSDVGSGGHAAALIYQANNGAVISQNSWGTDPGVPMDAAVQRAIDYFIEFAGCDNDGNQLPQSPMKGGLVIFAAGNESSDIASFPAAYYKVVSVSAMGPTWEKAYYTNRGSHITIMAPGGDRNYPFGMVYSTVPESYGTYAYMQGTSMACPHVSGIAGLIVSKYGGQGFTAEEAKQMLISAFRPENIDYHNPGFEGKLGRGYIDAAKALIANKNEVPEAPKNVQGTPDFTSIELEWTVPNDPDDQIPSSYIIYYATKPLTNEILAEEDVAKIEVKGQQAKVGEKIQHQITGLKLNTKYYFLIKSKDRWGLTSDLVNVSYTTKANLAPEITRQDNEPIRLTGTERRVVTLKVNDPEGLPWRYQLRGATRGVYAEKKGDQLIITITTSANYGSYKVEVVVIDSFEFETVLEIPFELFENTPPKQEQAFQSLYLPIGEQKVFDLSTFFSDPDGHEISYSAKAVGTSAVKANLEGSQLTIVSNTLGRTSIEISATDTQKATTRTSFMVQVVNDELVHMVYPIPATTELNVILANKIKKATLEIRSAANGALAMRHTLNNIDDQKVTLDVSKLSGGNYILHVNTDQGNIQRSFIKY